MASDPSECNIKVVCRFRPQSDAENSCGGNTIVKFPSNETVLHMGRAYTFDHVFKPNASQEHVYSVSAKPIVSDVLAGYNGTIFAYGQTASGKTHTMEGVIGDPVWQGIIPRIVQDIFNYIYTMDENLEFHIKVSYFEIYLDKIRDLLDVTKTNLAVHEDRNRVPYVKGATERFVSSPEEVLGVISEGKANRHVSVTNMNEHSSRSHSIFLINVKQENTETQKKLSGKLYLVDLAGSEKVSKTGAEGDVLNEAKNINKSLSALGNVISGLADGNSSYIPYRDSKMTRILQESLGGNSRTTIIICCSPSSFNEVETKTTLLFGQRAKTIKNTVVINEELTADEWKKRYEKEKEKNAKLQAMLAHLEKEVNRWRKGESVPIGEQINTADKKRSSELIEVATDQQKALAHSHVTDAELVKFDAERTKLYKELDERDDEIQAQSNLIETLRQQLADLEENLIFTKANAESLEGQVGSIAKEHDASKNEVKEVLQALEELAVNYDQKLQEVDQKTKDNESLLEDLTKEQHSKQALSRELEALQERMNLMTRKVTEITNTLLGELSEIGNHLGGNIAGMKRPEIESASQFDEEFTVARLYVTKMKSEIKTMVQLNKQLNETCQINQEKLDLFEKEIQGYKLTIAQHEAKMVTLLESIKDVEAKKRLLEEAVDTLNETLAKQTANEQMQIASLKDREEKQAKGLMDARAIKEALEAQMKHHGEAHAKQLALLRDEIQNQSTIISDLKEINQKRSLEEQQIKTENEKLLVALHALKSKNQELETLNTKKEHAQKDLQGLEETVARELATLNKLRQMFVKDLQARMKVASDDADGDETNSQAQKQKISFLENNLEQLTKVHKQLVRDNADLRLELPKLEKRLKATQERVKALEVALKDAKDGAMKDRSRYIKEVERWKQAFNKSQNGRRNNQPQIAKPIRPGQLTAGVNTGSATIKGNNINLLDGSSEFPRQQQGAIVARASSPSKIPIIPMSGSQPVIKGGYREGETVTIGGTGVSHRVKTAVGAEMSTRSLIRRPGSDDKRNSMFVESTSNMQLIEENLKGSASMDRLNMIDSSTLKTPRRLPSPVSRSPISNNLSGREAEIQALLAGGKSRSNTQSSNSSVDGSPWERRIPTSRGLSPR
ncbi:kinesin heavy chain isoform X2 [Hydra vulgaris]|uniref:Kinesin heavy chain isoform X2 n=1 Tax=Hydra vulgaris TaxID=6087 RepID=A0ABM4CXG1_HYDVU